MTDNTIDIKGGNNQILPNAEKSVQNIYYGDSAIKLALQHSEEPVENSTTDKDKTRVTPSESVEHEQPQCDSKLEQIVPAVWNDFSDCGKIIIVVSGDIANTGTEEEYGYAKDFFRMLLKEFAKRGLKNIDIISEVQTEYAAFAKEIMIEKDLTIPLI